MATKDEGRLIVTQQIRPPGGIGKSKRRTNLVFSPAELGKFSVSQYCVWLDHSWPRPSEANVIKRPWSHRVEKHLQVHPRSTFSVTTIHHRGLAASPGMALRAVQKGMRHLNSFHLPIVGSGSKYHQGSQAGTTLQGWKTENRCSYETAHPIQRQLRTHLLVWSMYHSKP